MTCEEELHGSVTRMACSILRLMGTTTKKCSVAIKKLEAQLMTQKLHSTPLHLIIIVLLSEW